MIHIHGGYTAPIVNGKRRAFHADGEGVEPVGAWVHMVREGGDSEEINIFFSHGMIVENLFGSCV